MVVSKSLMPVMIGRFLTISAKITPKEMVRAIMVRWNSLTDAITRAIYLKAAIQRLLALTKYDKPGKAGLRRFKLSEFEWQILEQLHPLLQVCR